jgi:hypothetical protein
MAEGITKLAVEGFKSIAKRQEIEIAPLTILAGANSSGKSSIMQPLLMLKQTLEATYDPGPLKIDGPNVKFTSTEEFLSKAETPSSQFRVELGTHGVGFDITFAMGPSGLEVRKETYRLVNSTVTLWPAMSPSDLRQALAGFDQFKEIAHHEFSVIRKRFFLDLKRDDWNPLVSLEYPSPYIEEVIHVPGLRGNPSRTYQQTGTGPRFPGTFENYIASLVLFWHKEQYRRYHDLNADLQCIGLAQSVLARRINDVAIELLVNSPALQYQYINVADVGFGVSQVLPVLVALRAADEGQLVYLEEPEIHLHPRAQTRLAEILANAAKRAVRVVAETHSSLLLRAVQTLVAKGDLDPDLVRLHWFTRDSEGVTQVSSTKLDANGAFGDWPEDFDDVALNSEQQYLDAVEDRLTH